MEEIAEGAQPGVALQQAGQRAIVKARRAEARPAKAARRAQARGATEGQARRQRRRPSRLVRQGRTNIRRARAARCRTSSPPSLATLATNAPDGADWVHEIKFDGYRMQARIDGGKVELLTRTGSTGRTNFRRSRRRSPR